MIRGQLVSALDFVKDGKTRREVFSYRVEDKWFYVSAGDGFHNVYKVTEFDTAGEEALRQHERPQTTRPVS